MKILIITALFPPDTAPSAQYCKELTRRLASEHTVTTLLYGHLPESVADANLISIDKRCNPLRRSWRLLRHLQQVGRGQDIVLIQNGPSVELACLLTFLFTKTKMVVTESDLPALRRTNQNFFLRAVHWQLLRRAYCVLSHDDSWPLPRPVLHPLKPKPEQALTLWEQSWTNHLSLLISKCNLV